MYANQHAFKSAGWILFGLTLLQFAVILWANQGIFMFTLDDPYIHLALAENLVGGHYGVNGSEYSAPASSIIWPFLIAPFTLLPGAALSILMLNFLLAVGVIKVAADILLQANAALSQPMTARVQLMLLFAFIWASNLVGLVYTGMEHVLQLLVCLLMLSGVLRFLQDGSTSRTLWAVIILAPLVRFECLALSAPALLLLFLRGQWRASIIAGALLLTGLVVFSLFLQSLGLHYLPSSVMVKSDVAASGVGKIISNLGSHYSRPRAAMMVVALFVLALLAASSKLSTNRRLLAGFTFAAVMLHMCFGRFGWYFRYEIYMWASLLLVLVYLFAGQLQSLLQGMTKKAAAGAMFAFMLFICIEHLWVFATTPISANNIYRQQYQMHRFVTEFYQEPVAVNDLGWVAYQNDEYVLDLWGLASKQALDLRKSEDNPQWMEQLCAEHNVELIMIYHPYERWIAEVPQSWTRIGQLNLGVLPITAGKPEVSFFVRGAADVAGVKAKLQAFADTLPEYSSFAFEEERKEEP